ncbi:hypothetical protein FRC11_007533 [Ceratobasidium sp. 423]|nr:hypothetical protein FRC11_007533 [Ceratobasidium sp. 423]
MKLISEEDLDYIWQEYQAVIWVPAPPEVIVNDDEDCENLTDKPVKGLNDFPLNAGVEHWSKVLIPEMKKMLLVLEAGLPGTRLEADSTPMCTPLWHQWVSVMEMVDQLFTATVGEPGKPTLVADEVGMGKTSQSILFLQILWHPKWPQDLNKDWLNIEQGEDHIRKWPMFLGEDVLLMRAGTTPFAWVLSCIGNHTFFMGHKCIPALPSVIIAPLTLLSMWLMDLTTWLSDSACNTLVYKGAVQQCQAFFECDGPYDKVMKSKFPEHTLVFIESSSLLAEGRVELTKQGDHQAGEASSGHTQSLAKTIFSQVFLLSILKEGHIYQNSGRSYSIMVTLMSQAAQHMVLTATPIFTHPHLLKEKPKNMSIEEHISALVPDLDMYLANPSPKIDQLIHSLHHHIGILNA